MELMVLLNLQENVSETCSVNSVTELAQQASKHLYSKYYLDFSLLTGRGLLLLKLVIWIFF